MFAISQMIREKALWQIHVSMAWGLGALTETGIESALTKTGGARRAPRTATAFERVWRTVLSATPPQKSFVFRALRRALRAPPVSVRESPSPTREPPPPPARRTTAPPGPHAAHT